MKVGSDLGVLRTKSQDGLVTCPCSLPTAGRRAVGATYHDRKVGVKNSNVMLLRAIPDSGITAHEMKTGNDLYGSGESPKSRETCRSTS